MRPSPSPQARDQRRISRDPLADNEIWASNIRDAIRTDMAEHGLVEAANGRPDFYVAFYVGLRDRYDLDAVGYGMPVFRRGFGWGDGRAATTCGPFR